MRIETVSQCIYRLLDDYGNHAGDLQYADAGFNAAVIRSGLICQLKKTGTGMWSLGQVTGAEKEKAITVIKVEAGGMMSIRKLYKRKKYFFKKSANWKLRFSLGNSANDELMALIPSVNWKKQAHEYKLQLNDEFEKECDALLILQAVHCANCSLSMMMDGRVPALVNI
ncbi:MAG: hypothetical protein U0V75_04075 [Ferruginibacter sp.]